MVTSVTTSYKLNEQSAQDRLEQFIHDSELTSLRREIALQRVLIEEAVNAGAAGLANMMITTLTRLAKAEEASLYRSGEMLGRDAVIQMAARIAELVHEIFAGRFEGWEDAVADLAERIPIALAELGNEQAKLTD